MEMEAGKVDAKKLVDKYPGFLDLVVDRNKVICKLTKHELPFNVAALESYTNGKKFQSLLKTVKKPSVVQKINEKYKEYFIASKKSSSRLFCTLTKKEINKVPHEIEKYITGYKFLKEVDRDRERREKGLGLENAEEHTNKNTAVEMDETEVEAEDNAVPYFAMSSDEEKAEEDTANIDGNSGLLTKDISEQNDHIELAEEIEKENGSDTEGKEDKIDDKMQGKKRKLKRAKIKKDRKTKKLKPGVK